MCYKIGETTVQNTVHPQIILYGIKLQIPLCGAKWLTRHVDLNYCADLKFFAWKINVQTWISTQTRIFRPKELACRPELGRADPKIQLQINKRACTLIRAQRVVRSLTTKSSSGRLSLVHPKLQQASAYYLEYLQLSSGMKARYILKRGATHIGPKQ